MSDIGYQTDPVGTVPAHRRPKKKAEPGVRPCGEGCGLFDAAYLPKPAKLSCTSLSNSALKRVVRSASALASSMNF